MRACTERIDTGAFGATGEIWCPWCRAYFAQGAPGVNPDPNPSDG
jgi:hypothetical protein